MKKLLALALLPTLAACSHSNRSLSSSDQPLDKIASYFGKKTSEGADKNPVQVVNGRLVGMKATSKNLPGHFIEDCRKEAIRQGIMDATFDGMQFVELSRKGSHRLSVMPEATGYRNEHIGAMVGMKMIRDGEPAEVTYTYDLEDDANGNCEWKDLSNQEDGLQKRSDVEQAVLAKTWPTFSEKKKAEIRSYAKNRGISDLNITKSSVKKLIENECEQFSITKAALASQQFFRDKFGTQPIMMLDFPASDVKSNLGENDHKGKDDGGKIDHLTGYWVFRMADRSGNKFATAKLSFDLQEKTKSCAGKISAKAEEL